MSNFLIATSSLQRSVDVINGIDDRKFPLILNRIVQAMMAEADCMRPFNKVEEEKLEATLSIEASDVRLMIHSATLILTQAAYHMTSPAHLSKHLVETFGMTEDKATALANAWASSAKDIAMRLRHKSIHPVQLEGVSWLLNIELASDEKVMEFEPKALLQLKTRQEGGVKRTVSMDMDQAQLCELYETLETIQSELDTLR